MKPVVKNILDEESLNLIKKSQMPLTATFKDYISVDIDVSPFDNSNTKKEGCNCTYKLCDGFAPMFAYFGTEGYMLACEFREGKQHSQAGTLDESIEDIMEIYHMHGTCEQFHSELKSDMDIERMPSGKFATNDMLLHVSMFTYNLLRMIGQISVNINRTKRENTHMVVRRRLKTVINDMIRLAAKYVQHARQKYIKASIHNRWLEIASKTFIVLQTKFE